MESKIKELFRADIDVDVHGQLPPFLFFGLVLLSGLYFIFQLLNGQPIIWFKIWYLSLAIIFPLELIILRWRLSSDEILLTTNGYEFWLEIWDDSGRKKNIHIESTDFFLHQDFPNHYLVLKLTNEKGEAVLLYESLEKWEDFPNAMKFNQDIDIKIGIKTFNLNKLKGFLRKK